jgi:hypothetical protein
MSSQHWELPDLAERPIMFWFPPCGRDNGVWADMWVILADLGSGDVTRVLDLLAEAGVGGYVAVPGGQKARAKGPVCHRLWVDLMQYGRAEDVLMLFLRGRLHSP